MGALLIVEGGVNHEGSLQLAKDMMYAAKAAGASIFKWQLYDPFTFLKEDHALYPKRTGVKEVMDSWLDLIKYGHELNMLVGFSIFSKDYLIAHKYSDFIKIAARQLDDIPNLLDYMLFINEVSQDKTIFVSYREDQNLKNLLPVFINKKTYFLCVVSQYPTPHERAISCIDTASTKHMEEYWGYSCHTPDPNIIYYAVQKGASLFEVHFTLDKEQSLFRDHKCSFDYEELQDLIIGLNNIEVLLH